MDIDWLMMAKRERPGWLGLEEEKPLNMAKSR